MSAATVNVSAPADRHSSAARCSDSESREISTRCAPLVASAIAVALPIPLDAPVTTATQPLIRMASPYPWRCGATATSRTADRWRSV
jgi:hypothetical protein